MKPLRYEDLRRTVQQLDEVKRVSAAQVMKHPAAQYQKARVMPAIFDGLEPCSPARLGADWLKELGLRGLLWVLVEPPTTRRGSAVAVNKITGQTSRAKKKDVFGYLTNVLIRGNPAVLAHELVELSPAARTGRQITLYDFPARFPAPVPEPETHPEDDQ